MDKISWGYARVSTEEQAQDSNALDKQIKKLQNAGCSKVYYDIRSRTTESRDGLNQLIADLKNCDVGSIDSLKFTRIDRIGSSSRLFYSLLEVLKIKKIKLVALEQGIDVDSLGGELTIDMLLAASKFEIKMLSHRVKSDRAYRTSQGRPNNVYPFGFKIADNKYVFNTQPLVCTLVDRREFTYIDVARLIFDLYFEANSIGKTCQKIHQYFGLLATGRTKKEEVFNVVTSDSPAKYKSNYIPNVPMHFSKASIRIILMNPVYAGGTPHDMYRYENGKKYKKPINEWNILWGTHEGIISQSQHEQILQNFKNNRSNKWAATDDKNPYIRKLTCIYCSGGFVRQYYKKKDGSNTKEYWYQCSNYRDRRCTNKKMISEKKLNLGIQRIFKAKALELGELIDRRLELESAPTLTETPELATLRNNLNSLRSMATNEIIERAILETEEKIDYLIRNAEMATPNYTKISEVLGVIQDEEFWLALSGEDKRRFLQEFVKRVMVDAPNVIDIIFSFRY